MDNKLLNKIPKKYHEKIKDVFIDEDGYWIYLKKGYIINNYYAETVIHEDTIKELLNVLRTYKIEVKNESI